MRIVKVWFIDAYELDGRDVFEFLKDNAADGIAEIARELEIDELDAIDDFGPGSFWLHEVGAALRVTHLADTVMVELLNPNTISN